MINYTIEHFLRIFLLTIPVFVYLTVVLQKGIYWIVELFFEEFPGDKNIFHHHFHYKDRRKKDQL